MVTTKEQKRTAQRQAIYRERHAARLQLVRQIDAILVRKTRRPDDMERLAQLIANLLDDGERRELKRLL